MSDTATTADRSMDKRILLIAHILPIGITDHSLWICGPMKIRKFPASEFDSQ